jgi:dienelactone hydrolase
MTGPEPFPVEILHRPGAVLRMRPKTRGGFVTRHTQRVYAEAHGTGLVMDVLGPAGPANGAAIIDVVSSGWQCDRVVYNEHLGFGLCDALCARGLTVFAMLPGSSSLFTGTEMVRHVHAAIRHVRAHAKVFAIDPARLGLVGVSAGGHLAALAALTAHAGRPDSRDAWRRPGTAVGAVAAFFPPADLVDFGGARLDQYHVEGLNVPGLLFRGGLGGRTQPEVLARLEELSPARVAARFSEGHPGELPPPLLLFHGTADRVVPINQSERLRDAWCAAGGCAELRIREQADHAWTDNQPELDQAAAWFAETLGG